MEVDRTCDAWSDLWLWWLLWRNTVKSRLSTDYSSYKLNHATAQGSFGRSIGIEVRHCIKILRHFNSHLRPGTGEKTSGSKMQGNPYRIPPERQQLMRRDLQYQNSPLPSGQVHTSEFVGGSGQPGFGSRRGCCDMSKASRSFLSYCSLWLTFSSKNL